MSIENQKPVTVNLSPLHDNILLEELDPIKAYGNIIVPEAHQKKLNQGRVVDCGPLVSPERIKLGDILFFPQHVEHRLDYGGKKFIVVTESNCLGLIRKVE